MLQKNKWAFSIVLAMILVIIMLLVAYNLLDFLIPFSKNTKGIENASNAYYQSYWRVEESINFISKATVVWTATWKTMPWTSIWSSIIMNSTWTTIPASWKWNSEFSWSLNRIWPGEPVQIYVWNWINWTNTKFYFYVPDVSWLWAWTLSWWTSTPYLPIINWQISGSWYTLNSSWSQITANEVDWTALSLWTKAWLDLNWSWFTLNTSAYNDPDKLNNCIDTCSLKLSIINELKTTDWVQIPYLEYKIDFWSSSVPQQYVDIKTEWKSYWFKKTINTKYRVDTTSEAFDFTVFQ